MHTIHKFKLQTTSEQVIKLTNNAQILHVGHRNGELFLWAMLYTEHALDRRVIIYVRGTGHPVPEGATYLRTVQCEPFIWHVFVEWPDGD